MAVTFRSKSAIVNTSGTSPTPTEPAGAVSGDYVVALYATNANTGNPTLPVGWATLVARTTVGSAFQFIVGGIQRTGSAPSYAFLHTGSIYRELHVLCFQGSGTVSLDAQSASGSTGAAILHDPNPGSVTPAAATSLSVAMGINWGGSSSAWTAPSGYVIRSDNSAGNDCAIADKSLTGTSPEDPAAFTGEVAASQSYWDGLTITLTDVGAVVFIAGRPVLVRQAVNRAATY